MTTTTPAIGRIIVPLDDEELYDDERDAILEWAKSLGWEAERDDLDVMRCSEVGQFFNANGACRRAGTASDWAGTLDCLSPVLVVDWQEVLG